MSKCYDSDMTADALSGPADTLSRPADTLSRPVDTLSRPADFEFNIIDEMVYY